MGVTRARARRARHHASERAPSSHTHTHTRTHTHSTHTHQTRISSRADVADTHTRLTRSTTLLLHHLPIESIRFTPPKHSKPRPSRSIAQVRFSKGVVSSERARVLQPPGWHPRHPGQDPLHQDHPALATHPLQRRRHALRSRLPRRGLDHPQSHATPRHATPRARLHSRLLLRTRPITHTLTTEQCLKRSENHRVYQSARSSFYECLLQSRAHVDSIKRMEDFLLFNE